MRFQVVRHSVCVVVVVGHIYTQGLVGVML